MLRWWARNSADTTAQMVWLPRSSGPVWQQPSPVEAGHRVGPTGFEIAAPHVALGHGPSIPRPGIDHVVAGGGAGDRAVGARPSAVGPDQGRRSPTAVGPAPPGDVSWEPSGHDRRLRRAAAEPRSSARPCAPCWRPAARDPRSTSRAPPRRPVTCCWSAPSTATPGTYKTIQAAVDAAQPGDWILVAPGDYHETGRRRATPPDRPRHRRLRRGPHHDARRPPARDEPRHGDRRRHQGRSRARRAAPTADAQNLGAVGSDGKAIGRNGIVVYKADGVSVDNLTACNFLAGSGPSGNEIWWNGGDDSGKIGLQRLLGQLPDGHLDLLRRRGDRGAVRDLLLERPGPGLVGPGLRQQLQRLGHVRGGLPAASAT